MFRFLVGASMTGTEVFLLLSALGAIIVEEVQEGIRLRGCVLSLEQIQRVYMN